jgi:hypothetical protein
MTGNAKIHNGNKSSSSLFFLLSSFHQLSGMASMSFGSAFQTEFKPSCPHATGKELLNAPSHFKKI